MIIAIDGPAGSGKSTIAQLVSTRLGARTLDTGAMYRAVTLRALEEGYLATSGEPSQDEAMAIAAIAENEPIRFDYDEQGDIVAVRIGDRSVTDEIRTAHIDARVSTVAALPAVRTALTARQRALSKEHLTVLEGRDIGTVVFPDAELKVFLTARPEVRAQRRAEQNASRGGADTDPAILLDRIKARDEHDAARDTAPLVAAADAVVIDTSDLTIAETVDRIVALAQERS
jgi:CMP/dCMP kinase